MEVLDAPVKGVQSSVADLTEIEDLHEKSGTEEESNAKLLRSVTEEIVIDESMKSETLEMVN